jgi:hypothetical protein
VLFTFMKKTTILISREPREGGEVYFGELYYHYDS